MKSNYPSFTVGAKGEIREGRGISSAGYYMRVTWIGIKSVKAGVVIGNKPNNQIFELSQLGPWRIKVY